MFPHNKACTCCSHSKHNNAVAASQRLDLHNVNKTCLLSSRGGLIHSTACTETKDHVVWNLWLGFSLPSTNPVFSYLPTKLGSTYIPIGPHPLHLHASYHLQSGCGSLLLGLASPPTAAWFGPVGRGWPQNPDSCCSKQHRNVGCFSPQHLGGRMRDISNSFYNKANTHNSVCHILGFF